MKKFGLFALVLGLGMFLVGCGEQKKAPEVKPVPEAGAPADAAPDAAAPAAPEGGEEAAPAPEGDAAKDAAPAPAEPKDEEPKE